jgi:hypothetical protein
VEGAHHDQVRRAVGREVGDEAAAAGQQPAILDAPNRPADIAGGRALALAHRILHPVSLGPSGADVRPRPACR